MKTAKIITLIISVLLLSNVLNATTPPKINAESKANMMVDRLSKDFVLTDIQKSEINAKAKIFIEKINNANEIKDRNKLIFTKKGIYNEYKIALDSILTDEQRVQLSAKQEERENLIISKYKNQH